MEILSRRFRTAAVDAYQRLENLQVWAHKTKSVYISGRSIASDKEMCKRSSWQVLHPFPKSYQVAVASSNTAFVCPVLQSVILPFLASLFSSTVPSTLFFRRTVCFFQTYSRPEYFTACENGSFEINGSFERLTSGKSSRGRGILWV